MAVRYTARMQFGPHEDSGEIRRQVLDVCRRGQVDEVMFFAFAEEQNDGHDTLDRLRAWMAAIRPWKIALEAAGVEVSLNPWHSLLHCDRHRALKPGQEWQTMVDWRGRAASAVVCPLDPTWRAYYAEAMRLFAAERFRVIWVDDDIRYHNHDPLDWGGCWCPLHIAEFNRRVGAEADRDEIVAAVIQPGPPHPWRAIWFDMWDELHCALLASWRDIVEAQGARLGLMSSGLETHAMEGRRWDRWWPALAQRFESTHRPHFWGYADGPADALVYGLSLMQQNRMVQPETVECSPEIENFPYGPWNKSFRQTAAQMTMAQVFASDRLAVSLYDFMGNLPEDEPERPAFLARVTPMLDWVGAQFRRDMPPLGVGIPWHPDMSRLARTDGAGDWRDLHVPTQGWERWLAPFGFAWSKTPHPRVNAIAGRMACCFSEHDLREWLARGLLLDGPAAAVLVERGMGDLLGLANPRFIRQSDALYSMEETTDARFGLRPGAQMSLNAEKPYKEKLLQGDWAGAAHIVSILRSPVQERVGHGCVLFENRLGGRVAVCPWDATAGTNLCTQRRAQLARVLDWLGRGVSTGSVEGAAWLTPLFLADGEDWRGAIWNGSPDHRRSFTVTPPDGRDALRAARLCTAEGECIEAQVVRNRVDLPRPMSQWDCVVLNPGRPRTRPGA